jgi:hypothetical protein
MVEGSLEMWAGGWEGSVAGVVIGARAATVEAGGVLQRKTLPTAWKKLVEELGTEAGLRELARPLSTAALRR